MSRWTSHEEVKFKSVRHFGVGKLWLKIFKIGTKINKRPGPPFADEGLIQIQMLYGNKSRQRMNQAEL